MKNLYIENYLKIPQEQKKKFLNLIVEGKDFKIENEKIIFSEESLLLGFKQASDTQNAFYFCKDFFKELKDINIDITKKSFDKSNNMILSFINSNRQIRV